ncbi:MAG: hypothetical protein DRP85_03315 [Candidatus Makaraimicrobium thalassicum]|nr:MAG: hypothetical protein DRP85_03315 [Candidatus Omnitrophota bacterium]
MTQVGNWVLENSDTTGTGNITLTGNLITFAKFRDALPAGDIWYALEDANGNRESGLAIFNGLNELIRSEVYATIVNGVFSDNSPTPIDLSGTSVISCTFSATAYEELANHLSDISNPHSVVASQVAYDPNEDPVSGSTNVQTAMLDHGQSIEQRVTSLSGVIAGGEIAWQSTSEFRVFAGNGEVVDSHTDPSNSSIIPVSWSETVETLQTGATITGITNILMTAAGTVLQIPGNMALSAPRDNIFLGIADYIDGVLNDVVTAPSVVKQTATDVYDLMVVAKKLEGSIVFPVDNALSFWTSIGTAFFPGISWEEDSANPNVQALDQIGDNTTPVSFYIMDIDGAIGAELTEFPKTFNPSSGVHTPLSGKTATIHKLYNIGMNNGKREFILLEGQIEYSNASKAVERLQIDAHDTAYPDETAQLVLLGYIGIGNDASDFDNVAKAWIATGGVTPSGSGGEGSSDHSTLINRGIPDQHPIEAIGTSGGDQLADVITALEAGKVDKDVINTITASHTLRSDSPGFLLYENDQPLDGKGLKVILNTGILSLQTITDTGSAIYDVVKIDRAGNVSFAGVVNAVPAIGNAQVRAITTSGSAILLAVESDGQVQFRHGDSVGAIGDLILVSARGGNVQLNRAAIPRLKLLSNKTTIVGNLELEHNGTDEHSKVTVQGPAGSGILLANATTGQVVLRHADAAGVDGDIILRSYPGGNLELSQGDIVRLLLNSIGGELIGQWDVGLRSITETVLLDYTGTVIDGANATVYQHGALPGSLTLSDNLETGQAALMMINQNGHVITHPPNISWYTDSGQAPTQIHFYNVFVYFRLHGNPGEPGLIGWACQS